MLFRYIPYMTGSFCSKNLDQAVSEKSQGKIRTNSEAASKVEALSVIDAVQRFFKDEEAARLPTAWNLMNAPRKQLQS